MSDTILPSPLNPTGAPERKPEAEAKARAVLTDTIAWLERLTANEDFQRYQEFQRGGLKSLQDEASNVERHDAAKRDAFAQKYFALLGMVDWPEKQLAHSRASLNQLNERRA